MPGAQTLKPTDNNIKSRNTNTKNDIAYFPLRRCEAESLKFTLSNGRSNPNSAILGVNEDIGHTGHQDFHHHDLVHQQRLGTNTGINPRYDNDATLKDLHLTGKRGDTGMSNPNTAKLGINHGAGPFGVSNPFDRRNQPDRSNELDRSPLKENLNVPESNVLPVERSPGKSPMKSCLKSPSRDLDSEKARNLRKGSFNSDGFGLPIPQPKVVRMSDPNMAGLVNENIGHTGHQDFHHHDLIHQQRLGPDGEIDAKYNSDATLRNLHLSGKPGDTGMSNPNTAKLGINHGAGPFGVTNPYDQTKPAKSPAKNTSGARKVNGSVERSPVQSGSKNKNVTSNRKGSFNPDGATLAAPGGTRGHRKSADLTWDSREMSNPNNIKYGVNRNIGHTGAGSNYHENVAAKESLGPLKTRNAYNDNVPSIAIRGPRDGISNPNNIGSRYY